MTGWVVGFGGTILKTSNGGEQWNAVSSGTSKKLSSVFFIDSSTGWVVGDGGTILKTSDAMTVVEENQSLNNSIPKQFELYQNYPNPFNPTTVIQFSLLERSEVSLKIYNLQGKEIISLLNEVRNAGTHNVVFDAIGLPTGIYFYRLHTGEFSIAKTFIVVK